MAFEIVIDTREVKALAKAVRGMGISMPVAEMRAINRTISNVQSAMQKEGAKALGVSKKKIAKRQRFDIKTGHGAIGKRNASRTRLEGRAVAIGRPFNLIRWNAQQTPAGVQADAWGHTKFYKGQFIMRAPAEFVAIGKTKQTTSITGKKKRRRIVRGSYGPGLTHVLSQPVIVRRIEKVANDKFPMHLESRVNELLQRHGFSKLRRA